MLFLGLEVAFYLLGQLADQLRYALYALLPCCFLVFNLLPELLDLASYLLVQALQIHLDLLQPRRDGVVQIWDLFLQAFLKPVQCLYPGLFYACQL